MGDQAHGQAPGTLLEQALLLFAEPLGRGPAAGQVGQQPADTQVEAGPWQAQRRTAVRATRMTALGFVSEHFKENKDKKNATEASGSHATQNYCGRESTSVLAGQHLITLVHDEASSRSEWRTEL